MSFPITRRQLLSYAFYGSALLVAAPILAATGKARQATPPSALTPLIRIDKDNQITIFSPSPEMGQGIETALSMLILEELGGSMDLVKVEPLPYSLMRDSENTLQWKTVPQFAGGSTSIPRNYPLLRQAGASARQLLLQAAAQKFNQPFESLGVDNGYVILQDGRKVAFGSLLDQAGQIDQPEAADISLKPADKWQIIGSKQFTKAAEQIVTGHPLYAMDMHFPGAKICLIARCPYFDGQVKSVDKTSALKIAGVQSIVEIPRPDISKYYTHLAAGVAVIADDFWSAKQARDALIIVWDKGPHAQASTAALHRQCDDLLQGQGQLVRDDGTYSTTLDSAAKVISRTYRLPLLSHAQLEPQNCIAQVTADNCTIIAPMQNPGGAARLAEAITGFDRGKMDVRYTRLGGGFGRRLSNDHVAEAVLISKLSGLPIKLIWTREDDLRHDFYRPMGHHQLTAAVDHKGRVIAWAHRLAGTPKYYRRDDTKAEELFGADMYIDDFPAALVPNLQYEYFPAEFAAPQGSWRAPAHNVNAFVVQSFLDEVASETGQDPLALRLAMLGEPKQLEYRQHGGPVFDTGRLATVFKRAAQSADWGRTLPAGFGLGLAGHFTFGGYCAHVAEVELLDNNQFKVHKVYSAIDVGTIINLEGIIAQVEGGVNDGLSAALSQQIVIQAGQVTNDNFDRYLMMRMADSPVSIQVNVIDSKAEPSGAGEMALPPISAAVANAIVAAGGKRIRQHPLRGELS